MVERKKGNKLLNGSIHWFNCGWLAQILSRPDEVESSYAPDGIGGASSALQLRGNPCSMRRLCARSIRQQPELDTRRRLKVTRGGVRWPKKRTPTYLLQRERERKALYMSEIVMGHVVLFLVIRLWGLQPRIILPPLDDLLPWSHVYSFATD